MVDWPAGSTSGKTVRPLLRKHQGRRAKTASSSSSSSYSSVPEEIISGIWTKAVASDPFLSFFWLGLPWEAEAQGRLGTDCRVLLVGCSSAALALDSNPGVASVLQASLSASLSASMYLLIPRIWILEPDLTLYDALILLI